ENVHVCHCRMCQKAVGGPFAVICPVLKSDFTVTRGAISWFHSSAVARRGFCRDCGTPLIFDYPDYPGSGVLAGSFDQPASVPPVVQYGVASRVTWWYGLEALPGGQPTYAEYTECMLRRIMACTRHNPDRDT